MSQFGDPIEQKYALACKYETAQNWEGAYQNYLACAMLCHKEQQTCTDELRKQRLS